MTSKQRADRDRLIRDSMASLVGNTQFRSFIDVLREQREVVIMDACTDSVIANQRSSMAAIGELRAYNSILSVYDEAVANPPRQDGEG